MPGQPSANALDGREAEKDTPPLQTAASYAKFAVAMQYGFARRAAGVAPYFDAR